MFNPLKLFRQLYGPWVVSAPQRPKPHRTIRLVGPEPLEERVVPATTTWDPLVGNLASNPLNWTNGVPGIMTPAIFDAQVSNAAITWDQNFTPQSITLAHTYTGQMTLNAGVVLAASNNITEDANSSLNVNFLATSCTLAVEQGTSTLTNFQFTGQNGLFAIEQGNFMQNTVVSVAGGIINNSSASIDVYGGTTLNLSPFSTLVLTGGANMVIYGGGIVNLDASIGNDFIATDGTAGSILENQGQVNVNGAAGKTPSLGIPVLNYGLFNINGGGNAGNAGCQLNITGKDALTANSDFDMAAGQLNLSGRAYLQLRNSYTQTGGVLQTTDGLTSKLSVGLANGGTATISGGSISMGNADPNNLVYGELDILAATVNFSGTYNPKINAAGGANDVLGIGGTLNIQNGSTINIIVEGTLPNTGNLSWTLILPKGAGHALNNFTNPNLNGTSLDFQALQDGLYRVDD